MVTDTVQPALASAERVIAVNLSSTKDLLEATAYLVAIVAGLGGGISFIVHQVRKSRWRVRAEWTGRWTNEGDVTGTLPSHFVDLALEAKDGELSGLITSRGLGVEAIAPDRSVVGSYSGRHGKIEVYHIRGGHRLDEATAKVSLNRRQLLSWTLVNGVTAFYPTRMECWKLDPDE